MTNPTGSILVRRGPTTDRNGFYPLAGEIIYDTTTNRFHIGDGVTAGGVSINQRDFPNPGVMIKGLTADSYLVAPGNTSGSDYQFLVYSKINGQYEFSTITSSGVAITNLKLSGANGITVTRTDTDPDQSDPTITTTGQITFDVNASTLRTTLSVNNVTNESKSTMFASPTFTGTTTMSTLSVSSSTGTNGQVLSSTGTGLQWTTLSSSSISNGTSNVSVAVDGAVTVTTNGSLALTIASDGSATFGGSVTVNGGAISLSATQITIEDSLLQMALANPANLLDIGLYGHYTDTSILYHTGFVRDATDNVWKLFSGVTADPTTTVDFTGATYDALKIGALTATTGNFSDHLTVEGVTSTGATGTGNLVFSASPSFTGTVSGITATMVDLGNVTNESKSTMFTSPTFTGITTLSSSVETSSSPSISSNQVTLDYSGNSTFRLASNSANVKALFTNVPTTTGLIIPASIIITQGSPAYYINAISINGVDQSIKWVGGSAPTAVINQTAVVNLAFICTATSTYTVIASFISYA